MTLTMEMQILAILHEKGLVRRKECYSLKRDHESIIGRHINSLITAGFIEEFADFRCPHCEKVIEGMKPTPGDKCIKLTESGEMMAKAVVHMEETT